MADLSTTYMGIKLKNPIIVGSSGLTNSTDNIIEIEKNGAAAVVLKSLFEEQIAHMVNKTMHSSSNNFQYPEADDYISNYTKLNDVDNYLNLIRDAKQAVKIPVIASVNCISSAEWVTFASKIQDAGADGLELNIFILPSDPKRDALQNEAEYFVIIEKVKKQLNIPLAIKISSYFSGLANMALKLSWTGIQGMVLFNRFFSPDIDIDKFRITASHVFSHPEELSLSLRWVAMLSGRLHCDIAASTGIHDSKAVIKQLWMQKHGFETTADFIGRMSLKETDNPAAYERVQFMKHFSGID